MTLEHYLDLQRVSPSEKLALVTELRDDFVAHPADLPVAPQHLAELDRRMEEDRRDPSRVTT